MPCNASGVCGDVESSLRAVLSEGIVVVSWETDSEYAGIAKYEVWRYLTAQGYGTLTKIGELETQGTCGTQQPYSMNDVGGTLAHTYVVRVIDSTGVVCQQEAPAEE